MARPLRLEFPGALWHVTSRGNNRKDICFDRIDRTRFVEILGETVTRYRWTLYAWALMTNHYHLFLQTPEPNLSRGMRDLNGEYARRFNLRHRRCGHVFQHRFHAVLIERESHFLEVSRYVVLNPVRAGIVNHPSEWRWSSYRATAGLIPTPSWLDAEGLLRSFHGEDAIEALRHYRRFVDEGIGNDASIWKNAVGNLFLGSRQFLNRMQELVNHRATSEEHPRAQRSPAGVEVDDIVGAVASLDVKTQAARALIACCARAYALPLTGIARVLGVSRTHAGRLAGEGAAILKEDPALAERIASRLGQRET
ncbi:MAG TPA: transposase [Thermoanaerobaculia bacterium]|nr:transposase [Thermoanaerobaculia bacterium]